MKVAIVDSGVPNNCRIKNIEAYAICWNSAEHGVQLSIKELDDNCGHSTVIHRIIERYIDKDTEILHVKILNDKLAANAECLMAAIELCIQRHTDIVNLSLGTTKAKYFDQLDNLVNRAAVLGTRIICACENTGEASYPANAAAAISVRGYPSDSGEIICKTDEGSHCLHIYGKQPLNWLDGHIFHDWSSSFWVPHVTGMVCRLYMNGLDSSSNEELLSLVGREFGKQIRLRDLMPLEG